jgi:hypothetical protein
MSLLLMSQNSGRVATGSAIIFWSTINYAMLIGGGKNPAESEAYGSNFNQAAGGGGNYNNTVKKQTLASPAEAGNETEKPENIGLCREVLRRYHESAQFNSAKIINSLIMQGINPAHICNEESMTEELFMFFIAVDSRFLYSFPEIKTANELFELTLHYFKLIYTQSYSSFKKIIAEEVIHKYISLYATTNDAIGANRKISPDGSIIGYLYERILGDNIKYYIIQAPQLSALSSQVYPIFRGTWKAVIKNHGFKGFNTENTQKADSL